MPEIRNFIEAHKALRKFYSKSTVYTLDNMHSLMDYLGNPQDSLTIVHVAGTSGKTSTSYFVAALLRASGAKVGLTVSPHVDEVNERVQINLQPLPEAEFCRELTEFLLLIEQSAVVPSYFECMVAFAYWEFARQDVDYAVVEVGLGGLLDATNVINRRDKLCIITDIGLDHTEILGKTLGEIAGQKAGIIQAGNEAFMYEQVPEVMAAVEQRRGLVKGGALHIVPQAPAHNLEKLPLFQERNFYLAETTVRWLLERAERPNLTDLELQQASTVYIPARMEIIERGDKTIIIDGSHNAQKLQTLFESIDDRFPGVPRAGLVGFVEGDKLRLHQSLDVLRDELQHMIVTTFYSEEDVPKQSVPTTVVTEYYHGEIEAEADPAKALQLLLARPESLLIITGSFYLLNHIRPLLIRREE